MHSVFQPDKVLFCFAVEGCQHSRINHDEVNGIHHNDGVVQTRREVARTSAVGSAVQRWFGRLSVPRHA